MRQFKVDAPEFFCFQIGDDEKVYKIPLATSMTTDDMIEFGNCDTFEKQVKWLEKYIGDIVHDLPAGVTADITKAWSQANTRAGVTEGESSALSDS